MNIAFFLMRFLAVGWAGRSERERLLKRLGYRPIRSSHTDARSSTHPALLVPITQRANAQQGIRQNNPILPSRSARGHLNNFSLINLPGDPQQPRENDGAYGSHYDNLYYIDIRRDDTKWQCTMESLRYKSSLTSSTREVLSVGKIEAETHSKSSDFDRYKLHLMKPYRLNIYSPLPSNNQTKVDQFRFSKANTITYQSFSFFSGLGDEYRVWPGMLASEEGVLQPYVISDTTKFRMGSYKWGADQLWKFFPEHVSSPEETVKNKEKRLAEKH